MHGRHPTRGGELEAAPHRLEVLVVVDRQVALLEAPRGLLAKDAARLAALVPFDDTAVHLEVTSGEGERRGVEPERVVVLREQRSRCRARDLVERSAGRLLGPVAAAPAEAANRPALATPDTPDAVECFRERRAALERELVLRERPGGEVHVRVVQPGKHDAAAKVDHVR